MRTLKKCVVTKQELLRVLREYDAIKKLMQTLLQEAWRVGARGEIDALRGFGWRLRK